MQHAGALTDSNTLQSLLDQSLLHTEAEWKIGTAFLYWRLERYDEQHRILRVMNVSFRIIPILGFVGFMFKST